MMKSKIIASVLILGLAGSMALYLLLPRQAMRSIDGNGVYKRYCYESVAQPSNGLVVSGFRLVVDYQCNISITAYLENPKHVDYNLDETVGSVGQLDYTKSGIDYVYGLDLPTYTVFFESTAPFNISFSVTIFFYDLPDAADWFFVTLTGIGTFVVIACLLGKSRPYPGQIAEDEVDGAS